MSDNINQSYVMNNKPGFKSHVGNYKKIKLGVSRRCIQNTFEHLRWSFYKK